MIWNMSSRKLEGLFLHQFWNHLTLTLFYQNPQLEGVLLWIVVDQLVAPSEQHPYNMTSAWFISRVVSNSKGPQPRCQVNTVAFIISHSINSRKMYVSFKSAIIFVTFIDAFLYHTLGFGIV
ncbi:hypothetical protein BDZ94DRAFT_1261232, partial [Collybia nuda]